MIRGGWIVGLLLMMSVVLPEQAQAQAQAQAQVEMPGLTACQDFARKVYRDVEEVKQVQLVNDAKTRLYRYDDKVGSQFVSSELLGTGRIVTKKGTRLFSYLCLLESDRKAVYFRILINTFP